MKGDLEYAGKTEKIIQRALDTLGLEYGFLKSQAHLRHTAVKQLKIKNLSAVQWFHICEILVLSPDCITSGYSRREHGHRIRAALEESSLPFPATLKLQALIQEMKRDQVGRTQFLEQRSRVAQQLRSLSQQLMEPKAKHGQCLSSLRRAATTPARMKRTSTAH